MAPAIELLGTYLIVLGWDYLPQEVQFGSGRRVLVPKLGRQRPLLLRTAPPRLETKARVWDLPLLTVVRPLGLSGVSFRKENGTKTDLTRPSRNQMQNPIVMGIVGRADLFPLQEMSR